MRPLARSASVTQPSSLAVDPFSSVTISVPSMKNAGCALTVIASEVSPSPRIAASSATPNASSASAFAL